MAKKKENTGALPWIIGAILLLGAGATIFAFSSRDRKYRKAFKDLKPATFPLAQSSEGREVLTLQHAYNEMFPEDKIPMNGKWSQDLNKKFANLQNELKLPFGAIEKHVYVDHFKKHEPIV